MMPRPLYSTLEVTENESPQGIREAFHRLSLKYHPDKLMQLPQAEQIRLQNKFKEINDAYQILSNADKRSQYDDGMINEQGHPTTPIQFGVITEGVKLIEDTPTKTSIKKYYNAGVPLFFDNYKSHTDNNVKHINQDGEIREMPYSPKVFKLQHPDHGVVYMMGSYHAYEIKMSDEIKKLIDKSNRFALENSEMLASALTERKESQCMDVQLAQYAVNNTAATVFPLESGEYQEELLKHEVKDILQVTGERNRGMVDRLLPRMNEGDKTFVVVGFAHLINVGDSKDPTMLDLLKEKGFTCEEVAIQSTTVIDHTEEILTANNKIADKMPTADFGDYKKQITNLRKEAQAVKYDLSVDADELPTDNIKPER